MASMRSDSRSMDFASRSGGELASGMVTPPRAGSRSGSPNRNNNAQSPNQGRRGRRSPGRYSRKPRQTRSPYRTPDGEAVTLNESLATTDAWDSDKEKNKEDELPSINERLAYLRPSRELLEFYRKKIGEFDQEHDEMLQKLDTYKMTYEEQHKVQWEIRQREEEIAELQKALSDMQVYLFQEREHVLRLYAENDRLKLRELEDRKKIHTLLQLSGVTESEISYFLKEPPAKAVVEQKLPPKLQNSMANKNITGAGPTKAKNKKGALEAAVAEEKARGEREVLLLQVESLQAQLQEQSKLAREQMEAMLEDRRVRMEEEETRRTRDADKVQLLTDKLHKTQDLLYASTQDLLSIRYDHRKIEQRMASDRDQLSRELDKARQQLDTAMPRRHNSSHSHAGIRSGSGIRSTILNVQEDMFEEQARREEEIQSLQENLTQAVKMQEMYREQVIRLEDELSRIREEGDIGKDLFKDRSEKMSKRLQLMNARYADLERRRNLEVEGFQTDIKNLRKKLKELEKQLYKVTLGMQEELDMKRPDDIDMQILRNVRKTAGKSKELVDELKTLKAKVYGMENDLRHL